jgi:hypothetical protein
MRLGGVRDETGKLLVRCKISLPPTIDAGSRDVREGQHDCFNPMSFK